MEQRLITQIVSAFTLAPKKWKEEDVCVSVCECACVYVPLIHATAVPFHHNLRAKASRSDNNRVFALLKMTSPFSQLIKFRNTRGDDSEHQADL